MISPPHSFGARGSLAAGQPIGDGASAAGGGLSKRCVDKGMGISVWIFKESRS